MSAETREQTAERLGITTEELDATIERLGNEAADKFEDKLGELYYAARDLGVVRACGQEHTEDTATTETVLDACVEFLGAIYAATGERYAVVRIKDTGDRTSSVRSVDEDGTIGGVTIANGGMWQAFAGFEPLFTRTEEAETPTR
jgi:hypothetical protein